MPCAMALACAVACLAAVASGDDASSGRGAAFMSEAEATSALVSMEAAIAAMEAELAGEAPEGSDDEDDEAAPEGPGATPPDAYVYARWVDVARPRDDDARRLADAISWCRVDVSLWRPFGSAQVVVGGQVETLAVDARFDDDADVVALYRFPGRR